MFKSSYQKEKIFLISLGIIAFFCPPIYSQLQSKAYLFKLMLVVPLTLAFTSYFFSCWGIKREKVQIHLFDISLLCLILWMSLSLLWSDNLYEGLKTLTPWYAAFSLSFLASNLLAKKNHLETLLKTIFVSGAVISLLGIFQHFFGNKFFMVAAPPAATFGNRNMASQYVLLCLPFALSVLQKRSRRWDAIASFSGWLMITFILLTTSRSAYFALLLELLAFIILGMLILKRSQKKITFNIKPALKLVFLTLITALLLYLPGKKHSMASPSLKNKLADTIAQSISGDINRSNERFPTWLNSFEMVKDHFAVGVGVGQWKVKFPLYNNIKAKDQVYTSKLYLTRLHNDILEYWLTLGTVGLTLLFLPVLLSIYFLYKLSRKSSSNDLISLMCLMSLLGISTPSLTSFPLQNITPILFIMLTMQIVASTAIKEELIWSRFFTIPRWAGITTGVILVILIFPLTQPLYNIVRSNACYFKADFLNQKNRNKSQKLKNEIYRLYKQAYQHQPSNNIVIMRYINSLRGRKKYAEAIQVGLKAQKYHPYHKLIHQAIFHSYFKLKNIKGMSKFAKKMLEYSPRYYFSYLSMGHTYWFSGRKEKAIEYYKKTFKYKRAVKIPQEASQIINLRKKDKV